VQKKNSTVSLQKTKDIRLSIQFSLDGFSFCVIDSVSSEKLYFTEYKFKPKLNSPEDLLEKIEHIFKNDANLQLEYDSVLVIHQNNLSTLVPSKYFKENLLSKYLDYNIKTLKTDYITFDEVNNSDAKNVYIPYVNINNYLFQNFGEFEFKHHKTVLLEKLLALENSTEKRMFVNVYNDSFDIVVLEDNKILFSNAFEYNSKEDFIYYILFTAEQLQLNPEEFKLYFSGAIETTNDIYKISYKYIKNIFFLESTNSIFHSIEASNHSNFILLG
jgi:hypothetical protein